MYVVDEIVFCFSKNKFTPLVSDFLSSLLVVNYNDDDDEEKDIGPMLAQGEPVAGGGGCPCTGRGCNR